MKARLNQFDRTVLVMGVISLAFMMLGYRLFQLHVLRHAELSREASQVHAKVVHLEGRRGQILDVRHNLLANSLSTYIVTADPSLTASHAADMATQLAPVLGADEADLRERLGRDGRYVRLKQRVSEETKAAVQALNWKGIFFEDQYTRSYPHGPLGSHVIGFVNGEHKGVNGVELTMNRYLAGRAGYKVIERDRKGRPIQVWTREAIRPRDGYSVVLTIDHVIQHIAETELERAMEKHRPLAGTIIVSRPRTGEILAMSGRPTYDPNHPGAVPADAWRNRAISDVAEPGSTFKVVTIAGALNDGSVSLQEQFDCENGAFIYAGRALRDAHPYGLLTVDEILYHSSNIGAAKVGLKMGSERMRYYINRFGFGTKTGIALPGEVSGIAHPLSKWTKLSITRIPMGHEIAVTPIQMLMAVNAVANGGRLMRPLVIDSVMDGDGEPLMRYRQQQVAQVIQPRASLQTVSSLRKVVQPGGTARRAALTQYEVAGKTGTAQKVIDGRYASRYYSSFIGFLPATDPEISILVSLDDPQVGGYYGGTVAGPVFREVALAVAQYLGLPEQPTPTEVAQLR